MSEIIGYAVALSALGRDQNQADSYQDYNWGEAVLPACNR
jgi:hypothetical protein